MIKLFRRKTFLDRVAEALGGRPKRSGDTAVKSGLIALGSVAGVTAASAVASAVRKRQDQEGQGDQDDRS
ncbi:hypothetical protein GCM10009809_25180 [Isoptericola hypogeus]|uniref:Uncharacterized protein n=1 Tax=Isoptericola hypogeus TaxID=300179 RepID=A0ABN2JIJ8_9MICO